MEGTGFWDGRDVRPLPIDPQEFPYPNMDSINDALDVIEQENFKLIMIATSYIHASVIILTMEQRGMVGNYQIVGMDWTIMGLEYAFDAFGVNRTSLENIISIRPWEDFTDPGILTFQSQFEEWHVAATGGDPFWSSRARVWTANECNLMNVTAQALHTLLYEEHLDINDVNGTNLADRVISNSVKSVIGGQVTFSTNPSRRGQYETVKYAVASYNPVFGLFMDTGEWSSADGFSWKTGLFQQTYIGGSPTAAPDSFLPDPVGYISITNTTTSSFEVKWSEPDLKDGRNTRYHVEVMDVSSLNVLLESNATGLSFVAYNLPKDRDFIVTITVHTNGGASTTTSTLAQTNPDVEKRDIQSASHIAFSFIASLLIVCSVLIHASVIKWSSHPVMKASSPPFLHVILAGSIIGYTSIIFNGIHDVACTATPIALSISFALMFGSLLSRTWRVYKIFLSNSLSVKRITNRTLANIVTAYFTLEFVSLVVWFSVDMPQSVLSQSEGNPFVYEYTCRTKYPSVWWATQLVPKISLLTVGCILSFRVRNIADGFNESRPIAFSLWNTFLMMTISLGVRQMITEQEVKYMVMASGVVIIVGSTVFILFIPKIAAIIIGKDIDGLMKQNNNNTTYGTVYTAPKTAASPPSSNMNNRLGTDCNESTSPLNRLQTHMSSSKGLVSSSQNKYQVSPAPNDTDQ